MRAETKKLGGRIKRGSASKMGGEDCLKIDLRKAVEEETWREKTTREKRKKIITITVQRCDKWPGSLVQQGNTRKNRTIVNTNHNNLCLYLTIMLRSIMFHARGRNINTGAADISGTPKKIIFYIAQYPVNWPAQSAINTQGKYPSFETAAKGILPSLSIENPEFYRWTA